MTQYTNEEWLTLLAEEADETALNELRELLVRGLRFALSSRVDSNLDAMVEDFTQDALLKILDKLDSFRGDSKFTTWAQKIAVRVALTELRRKRWKDHSIEALTNTADGSELEPLFLADTAPTPELQTAQGNMFMLVQQLIKTALTDRQRQAIHLVMVKGMPMDLAAEKMDTNRNALYKLIHDARVRLKSELSNQGLSPEEVLAVFN